MNHSLAHQFDALAAWRQTLERRVRGVANFVAEHALADDAGSASLDALQRKLSADKLVLACVAEVSRGKSELLNAMFFADAGRRVLPAAPGRTTMCPVELSCEAGRPAELALLPIDTRLGQTPLAEWRTQPEAWQRLSLDPRRPEGLAEALNLVTQTRRVSTAVAAALGFWNDSRPQDNPPRLADGSVEVPAWRHALINYPHPLLQRGLVVVDTPGLNAVGAEPELTLGLLAAAHAIVFLLAADTGVSRSDLDIWTEHLGERSLERFVVLNKTDILDDPLSTPAAVAAVLEVQRRKIAQTLDMPAARVYPLSARDALAARIAGDGAALTRSGLPVLERALAHELLPRQRELLARATATALQPLRHAATRRQAQQRRHQAEQLLELRGLRGKSQAKVKALLVRLDAEVADFERCNARLTALRSVQLRHLHKATAALSSDALRNELAALRSELSSGALHLGARKAFAALCERLRAALDTARGEAGEIQQMLLASCRQLNAEFGFAFAPAGAPDLEPLADELALIERSYGRCLGPLQAWRLSNASFTEQFQRMLLSKLRVVFENAAGEIELWSKSASAQIEQQLRERRRAFAHRREALQRIQAASGELEQRIAELEQQEKRLAGAQWRLDSLIEQALLAAQALPGASEAGGASAGADDDAAPLRSSAS
ncbi:MAG TPA: dynamin family protein [Rubrivivax sp.]|nr:dynamin family protein [Rubrivivax sp.]